jgi:hypothetical protein
MPMQSGTSIVAVIVITLGGLVVDMRIGVMVGGSVVVTVVPVMVHCIIDIVRRATLAASVFLPPSSIVAFVAEGDSRSDTLPERSGGVGLPCRNSSGT